MSVLVVHEVDLSGVSAMGFCPGLAALLLCVQFKDFYEKIDRTIVL